LTEATPCAPTVRSGVGCWAAAPGTGTAAAASAATRKRWDRLMHDLPVRTLRPFFARGAGSVTYYAARPLKGPDRFSRPEPYADARRSVSPSCGHRVAHAAT